MVAIVGGCEVRALDVRFVFALAHRVTYTSIYWRNQEHTANAIRPRSVSHCALHKLYVKVALARTCVRKWHADKSVCSVAK